MHHHDFDLRWKIHRLTGPELISNDSLYSSHIQLRRETFWKKEGLSEEQIKADYLDLLDQRAIHFVALLTSSARLIGMAQFDPVTARLRQVLVIPEFSGKGIGRQLVNRVEQEASQSGHHFLQVNAWQESVGFYRSLRFLPHGQSYLDRQQQPCQILLKQMPLSSPTTASSTDSPKLSSPSLFRAIHPPLRNAMGPAKTRLILVRHGESLNNVLLMASAASENPEAALTQFHSRRVNDPPLSPLGVKQAVACGEALLHHITTNPVTVWISPMLRTLQTALSIDATLQCRDDVTYVVHRHCYEFGGCYLGEEAFAGLTPQQITQSFPRFTRFHPTDWQEQSLGWYQITGATSRESRSAFIERIAQLVAEIWKFSAEKQDTETLMIVAHGDFFDLLLSTLSLTSSISSFDPLPVGRFIHENTGISNLALDPHKKQAYLVELNNITHLFSGEEYLVPPAQHRLVGWERNHHHQPIQSSSSSSSSDDHSILQTP